MICKNCGIDVPEGNTHCYNCGAPVTEAPTAPAAPVAPGCVYCGAPLAEGSVFCTNCGQMQPTSDTPVSPVAPAEKKPFPMKLLLMAGGGLVLIIALIIVLVSCGGNSPEAVAEEFVACAIDCDIEGMFDLVPPAVLEWAEEEEDMDIDELIEDFEDEISNSERDRMAAMSIEEVGEADQLKKSKIKSLQKQYDEMDIEIEDAVEVEVTLTIDEDYYLDELGMAMDYLDDDYLEELLTQTMTITLIQVDGDWYVEMSSLDIF